MSFFEQYINNSLIYWIVTIAYFVTILSIIGVVISENRNPLKSLAWVTVLLLFPIGGIILYIFFGRSLKDIHMISRRNRRRLLERSHESGRSANSQQLLGAEGRQHVQLGRSLVGANYTDGNIVEVFTAGPEMFAALLDDISRAKHYIHLQFYIIDDDATGERLAAALEEAARRGVAVRVIYDDIGSIHISRRYVKRLRAAGVEIYPFFRVKFPPFGSRINWRNHRKVCAIDGHSGFIGGMNIADRYMTGGKFDRWRDSHLRVMGPAVASLQYSFAIDWNFMGQPLVDEPAGTERYAPAGRGVGLQLVTSGPTSRWSNLAFMMLKAIGNAKKRVYLQTPYFLPTDALLRTLQAAALARVDVRVMMPGRSDSTILTLASRSYIQECLRAGIKIYFYEAGMLHAKTLVVDDDFASVGSTNFDFRSFEHNFEANFFIYDREINSRLTADFEADMALSRRIRASEWRHRPVLVKAKESIYRLLSPIL